jgi:hypothetical protein
MSTFHFVTESADEGPLSSPRSTTIDEALRGANSCWAMAWSRFGSPTATANLFCPPTRLGFG